MTTDNLATVEIPTLSYSTIEQAIEALECLQMTFLANNIDCADTKQAIKELRALIKQSPPCEPINFTMVKAANRSFIVNKVSNFRFSTLTTTQLVEIATILDEFCTINQQPNLGENKCL